MQRPAAEAARAGGQRGRTCVTRTSFQTSTAAAFACIGVASSSHALSIWQIDTGPGLTPCFRISRITARTAGSCPASMCTYMHDHHARRDATRHSTTPRDVSTRTRHQASHAAGASRRQWKNWISMAPIKQPQPQRLQSRIWADPHTVHGSVRTRGAHTSRRRSTRP